MNVNPSTKYTILIISFLSIFYSTSHSQVPSSTSNKGEVYVYWGWNLDAYTKSDIHFSGDNYDFTLFDVIANGRQSDFAYDPYFHPSKITIPQYNFRIGYFINDKYNISLGVDHMKYVVQDNQSVRIDGYIEGTQSYDGVYDNENILLTKDFLEYEHTDGLNYINVELRRHEKLYQLSFIKLNATIGLGAGALLPKTNATLLDNERHDDFHLSGFGVNGILGLQATLWRGFFVQTEFKFGYINMPDIRTTSDPTDRADQSFWFTQNAIVFGWRW